MARQKTLRNPAEPVIERSSDLFYLKSDTTRKQPYRISDLPLTHFETSSQVVHFYPIRTDHPTDYILDKKRFAELFIRTKET